jgi:hypothetical protein
MFSHVALSLTDVIRGIRKPDEGAVSEVPVRKINLARINYGRNTSKIFTENSGA